MKNQFLFLIILSLVFFSIIFRPSIIEAKIKSKQAPSTSSLDILGKKFEVFSDNSEAFKELVDGFIKEKKEVDNKQRNNFENIVDSMLSNNKTLQDLTKEKIKTEEDNDLKNFYARSILPNLQNINRQLTRMKIGVKSSNINYKNLSFQADRVKKSIDQIVEKIDKLD